MTQSASVAMNSPGYWDSRFATDWSANDGPAQTRFFAMLATTLMPAWLREDIATRRLSIHDLGCAEGDALPVLAGLFKTSKISGSDVSAVAIDIARNRHRQFDFSLISTGRPAVKADVIFCSNTIEHLTDWRVKLDTFAGLARSHLIVLAPFREGELFKEHVASFDFDMIPAVLGGDMKLAHVSVRTTTDMPGSRWVGQQFMAIWSRSPEASVSSTSAIGTLDDIDLRSVAIEAIPGCLMLAKAAFSALDDTRTSLTRAQRAVEDAKAQAAFRWTERENEFTTVRVGLENELHTARVELERLSQRFETMLGAEHVKATEQVNAFTAIRVGLENELHTARVELERQKHETETALGQAQYKWTERENEFATVRVSLENDLHNARVALDMEKYAATTALGQAEVKRVERDNEFLTTRVELENALYLARAALQTEAHEKRAGFAANAQVTAEYEQFKQQIAAATEQQLQSIKSIKQTFGGLNEATTASSLSPQEIGNRIADLRHDLDTLKSEKQLIEAELSASRDVARADTARREEQVSVLKADLAAVRGTAQATADRFNNQIAARERALQASFDTQRQNYSRVTTMRPFLLMMKAVNVYTRLRRIRFTLPPATERLAISLPRLDAGKLFAPPDANTFGRDAVRPVARQVARTAAVERADVAAPSAPPRDVPVILLQVGSLDRGGVEQVVFDHATAFTARGERVVVFAIERGGDMAERLIQAGIYVETFGGFEAAAYRRAIEALKIKAAYLHANLDGIDLLAQAKVPTVEVVHNTYHWLQGDAAGYRAKAQHVQRFIAVSSGVADFHADVFGVPRASIEVVNNAINPDGLVRPERHLLEWARRNWRQQFTFVHVAQFLPPKAHAALVTAFADVHAKYPHARLRLIGAAADAGTFEQIQALIAKRNLGDVIDTPGFLDRRQLSRALAAAHVFVQPSVFEGFSVAKTEAAYFGLPMILTNVGGARDMIHREDCGIVIEPPLKTLKGVSPTKILSTGLAADAPHVAALTAAMTRMLTEYETWAPRGFIGAARAETLTLETVIDRYLAIATPHPADGQPATT